MERLVKQKSKQLVETNVTFMCYVCHSYILSPPFRSTHNETVKYKKTGSKIIQYSIKLLLYLYSKYLSNLEMVEFYFSGIWKISHISIWSMLVKAPLSASFLYIR